MISNDFGDMPDFHGGWDADYVWLDINDSTE
jgi:hypothetical protein